MKEFKRLKKILNNPKNMIETFEWLSDEKQKEKEESDKIEEEYNKVLNHE